MSVKIVCPHCDKEFDDWEPYANHLLEKHRVDKERCAWAERALAADSEPLPEQSSPEAPQEASQPEVAEPPDAPEKKSEVTKGTYPRTKWSTAIGLGFIWIAVGILASLYSALDTMSQGYVLVWLGVMPLLASSALATTVYTVVRWKELS